MIKREEGSREPAGLYIHIPFCRSKCPYCDFYSLTSNAIEPYFQALEQELALRHRECDPSTFLFDTVYIGGGTPSLVPVRLIAKIVDAAGRYLLLDPNPEITIEANPDSLTPQWLEGILDIGATRLSVGIQSLTPQGLKILGRIHDVASAVEAVQMCLTIGVPRVSGDFIYGWPGQRVQGWEQELKEAVSLGLDHLSCYLLSVEPGTRLAMEVEAGGVTPVSEGDQVQMMAFTESFLSSQGYEQYEISNFAAGGATCRHNIRYWENGSYFGIGASAVSHIEGRRIHNVTGLDDYLRMVQGGNRPVATCEELEPMRKMGETLVMGLRMNRGVCLDEVGGRFGLDPLKQFSSVWEWGLESGLLERKGARVRLTARGRRLSNALFSQLV